MPAQLSIQHLKKYYASKKAVDDISFDIPKGSVFGILGPNGAGKTTLLRMITGIFLPDSGDVLMNDQPLNQRHSNLMGYMPEERGLYKKMKVGEHAVYLAQLKGLSHQDAETRCREWFERLDMKDWWRKKVSDLSKGMGQKLQFVATVVHQPELLILDEPFSGLDPVNTQTLKNEIFRLAKEGATIIFSTHRMEQVEEICDRIVLINQGKKILDGEIEHIRQQYKQNIFRLQLSNLSANPPEGLEILNQDVQHRILKFHLLNQQNPNDVLRHYIEQGVTIEQFHEILPTLNEIFIRLVENSSTATVSEKRTEKI